MFICQELFCEYTKIKERHKVTKAHRHKAWETINNEQLSIIKCGVPSAECRVR